MGQMQKVSWRSAGYAALGTVLVAASVVAVVNSDGVHPTALTSNAATRWLVDRVNGHVVLVDGLAGRVLAKIASDADLSDDEVAVQGAGGSFLVAKSQGSVRTISTAKLQLGTPQPVALLTEQKVQFGVGTSGLTVVSPVTSEARVVAVDDVSREVDVPQADNAMVAADGSMWLLTDSRATHVNVDQSSATSLLRSAADKSTTIGAQAVTYDAANRTVRWLDGADVSLDGALPNPTEALMQEPGDAAPCVWVGSQDTLVCVGATGVERTVIVEGLDIGVNDRLAVAGSTAVLVTDRNDVTRIDLDTQRVGNEPRPTVPSDAPELTITASGDLIWLDNEAGTEAWVAYRYGINPIEKDEDGAPVLDAQGQPQDDGSSDGDPATGGGNSSGEDDSNHLDDNNVQDPPVAVDDSVTARAGNTITIPVTGNDYDPDGDPIVVVTGDKRSATHGTTDVLDGSSIAYRPEPGFSGSDSFEYTITDDKGATASATVNVELFPPDSPNRPPIARPDRVKTRIGRAVIIDVLSNDIDPERDMLTISSFEDPDNASITDAKGPTGLPALRYTPPPGEPGTYVFTYQAVDPQGGTSAKTKVTVEVAAIDSANTTPVANPDSIRMAVGVPGTLNVLANDFDEDGDPLTISYTDDVKGVTAKVVGQRLSITLQPGADTHSVLHYTLTDGTDTVEGKVLVLRLSDNTPNRPPVANADSERVVIGNSVKIAVTANDIDPDNDTVRLLTVGTPADGTGTTSVEGNSVRFTPNLPDISEPTPVTFPYTISDGHGNEAPGTVTVTVLVEALPKAPDAGDDFGDTVTNKPVTIDVLANDSDPSGGKPSLIADPVCGNGGKAFRTPDDRVTYTPPTDATGTFKCKYTVANSQALRAEASIIITVTTAPVGNRDPTMDPAATNLQVKVGEQLSITADAVANDDDGDKLMFSAVSVVKPEHGRTNFNSFPSQTDSIVYTAPPEGNADRTPTTDTLNVTISDGRGGNTPGTISIKLIDDPPPPSTPPSTQPIERPATVGDDVTIDIVALLRDQNPTTTLSLTNVSMVSGPGTASRLGDIAVITPTGAGQVVARYTVANAAGVTADNQITILAAEPVPSNPPLARDDAMTIDSGGSNSIDLLTNDSGISDPGDIPALVLLSRPPSSFGSVQLVNSILTFVAAPGAGGQAQIRYSLSDGTGQSSTAFILLNVLACSDSLPQTTPGSIFTPYMTPVNINLQDYVTSGHVVPGSVSGAGLTGTTGTYVPPPGMNSTETVTFLVGNGCQQTAQGQLTIDVNRAPVGGNVSRAMSRGETLSLPIEELASDDEALSIVALTGNPAWVSLPGGIDHATSINVSPPSNLGSGNYTFTATVQDLGGLTAVANITLSINNQPPTAIADNYFTDLTDTSYTVPDPTLNDTDSEPGALTVGPVAVISGPSTILTVAGNSIVVFLGHGVTTLSYTIVDEGGLTSSSTITITSNRAPTIQPGTESTNGAPSTHLPLIVAEPDGDPVTVTCDPPPGFSYDLLINPNPDGNPFDPFNPTFELLVFVPPEFNDNEANSATIPCTVTDSFGARATAPILITVE
jgi:large repetitive protein